MIIEKAEHGDKDVPIHAMMLFMDLFELFIKILQILLELSKNEDKKKKKWTLYNNICINYIFDNNEFYTF